MGNYNPYSPHILGQEWCPIREEKFSFPNYTEHSSVGYEFSLNQAYTLTEGRWYVPEPQPNEQVNVWGMEITEAGKQADVGPIRRVIIPVNNGTSTGASNIQVSTSVATSLYNPGDALDIRGFFGTSNFYAPDPAPAFTAYFAGNAFANLLDGKRILGINVLFQHILNSSLEFIEETGIGDSSVDMSLATDVSSVGLASTTAIPTAVSTLGMTFDPFNSAPPPTPMHRVRLPNTNLFWNGTTGPVFPDYEYLPWLPADLARFEASASQRYGIRVSYSASSATTTAGSASNWPYMALEVFYCEENRVAVGGGFCFPIIQNTNKRTLRTLARAANPSIGPGAYSVNLFQAGGTTGQAPDDPGPYVESSALRQLYQIPTLQGVNVKRPWPLDGLEDVDKTFERVPTNIIPSLTLHTSSGPVPEIFPYSRQAKAQVYGTVTATQEILDNIAGGARSYPQVRYYARRWGDTTVPLILDSPSIAGSSVTLTPSAFDELDEILDGWKEVTLRFDTAPSMGSGTNPQWRWSATGENPANRWEVLGAAAPALSGTPLNLYTQAPSPHQLGPATYGAPISGAQVNLGWVQGFSPMVTATTDDPAADAMLIFSTDPPTPTGLMVSPLSQALAFTDPDCPVDPACIPSELFYNQLSWTPISGASVDSFDRVVASGWGVTDIQQTWTTVASTATYSVNGSYGVHTHPAGAMGTATSVVNVGTPDQELQVDFLVDALDTASTTDVMLIGRYTDDNNHYQARVNINVLGAISLQLQRTVGGVTTTLTSAQTFAYLTFNAETWFTLKFRIAGTALLVKLWASNNPEPDVWSITTTDSTLTTGNSAGVHSIDSSAAGIAFNVFFDNWSAAPAEFGALELQRYDPVDGEFSTIMLGTSAAITGFSDYEARVGQDSVYRIRERNVYDFAGLWSTQVTGAVASPGVVGGDVALLLFTSNFRQDGSVNLAYSSEWEGDPEEQFNWPEASQVALQSMYRKNFPTAFRPLERGGETFVRDILVNAAGIPEVVSQNGFKSLRDMAWDTVPYVCVRDELGNRWYSTVVVPQGSRKRMVNKGHLNVAQVQVVEVTEAPYPVDPS